MEILDKQGVVTIQELLVSSLAQMDVLAKLPIEKELPVSLSLPLSIPDNSSRLIVFYAFPSLSHNIGVDPVTSGWENA